MTCILIYLFLNKFTACQWYTPPFWGDIKHKNITWLKQSKLHSHTHAHRYSLFILIHHIREKQSANLYNVSLLFYNQHIRHHARRIRNLNKAHILLLPSVQFSSPFKTLTPINTNPKPILLIHLLFQSNGKIHFRTERTSQAIVYRTIYNIIYVQFTSSRLNGSVHTEGVCLRLFNFTVFRLDATSKTDTYRRTQTHARTPLTHALTKLFHYVVTGCNCFLFFHSDLFVFLFLLFFFFCSMSCSENVV